MARAFLQDGGVVVYEGDQQAALRRRTLIAAGVIGVLAVAAVVVVAVLASRGGSVPHASNDAADHTSTTVKKRPASTTTVPPLPTSGAVTVDVLNASQADGIAAQTAAGLKQEGFAISAIGNAPNKITAGDPSTILYGPAGLPAAHTLANSLNGPVALVASPMLAGNNVVLSVASPQLTVTSSTTTSTTGAPRSTPQA